LPNAFITINIFQGDVLNITHLNQRRNSVQNNCNENFISSRLSTTKGKNTNKNFSVSNCTHGDTEKIHHVLPTILVSYKVYPCNPRSINILNSKIMGNNKKKPKVLQQSNANDQHSSAPTWDR
jgi:hypothetical protein